MKRSINASMLSLSATEATAEEITAVCLYDLKRGHSESARQKALLISYKIEGGLQIDDVVFGWELPEDDGELAAMLEDSSAWESDDDVLATVQPFIPGDISVRRR